MFRNSPQARQMSVGFIFTRRRLTRTASSQMGERWHAAGNQDDPRPSPPNGTDRATSRTSVRSQAHWGLELELRRPGALAARLLRVVSGSPAAARVWCEERSSPNFASCSGPSRRLIVGTSKRGRRPSLVCVFFLATLTCSRPSLPARSPHHQFIVVFTYRDAIPFSKSSPPACGSWG